MTEATGTREAEAGHDDEVDSDAPPPSPPWLRAAIAVAAVVALLMVGASAGILVMQLRGTGGSGAPAADSVDVGFLQDMTVHHRQAVFLADAAREITQDPEIKSLSFDIGSTQLEQVGRMQGWLALWGRDPLPQGGHMGWMSGPEGHHDSMAGMPTGRNPGTVQRMPGMATQDELNELVTLTGDEFDVRFLQLMLRHHQGGVPMLQFAAERAADVHVRNFARQVAAAQDYETGVLTDMLTRRGAQPLPPP